MREARDGLHCIKGTRVYVLDGLVNRAISERGTAMYPCRYVGKGTWQRDRWMTLEAYRACVRRGTVELF